ncbi:hypothetical protein D3C76_1431300 [compost metagenome]
MADCGKGTGIVGVDDQAGDFIFFVRDQRFAEEVFERDVSEGHLCGNPFAIVAGRNASEKVT